MILFTCTNGKSLAALGHPCGKAAQALDEAGHTYEMKQVKGGTMKLWTLPNRARDRAEVEELSGQRGVPILVLDDGDAVTGSGNIVSWAREKRAAGHDRRLESAQRLTVRERTRPGGQTARCRHPSTRGRRRRRP